jgi:two-component system phosphate regulon sensor histidine kinase PhoR
MFGDRRELKQALEKLGQLEREVLNLAGENRRSAAILNSMVEGVIALDKDSRILSVNPAIEKIFAIDASAVGRLFLEAIPNNGLYEVITEVLRCAEPRSKELSLVWPVQRVFKVNASPLLGPQSVSGCLLVIHDVTEMRRLETVRSDFVANVSHELKTPLTSIRGFVETLLEGALDDREHCQEFLRIIQEHAERLNNLINDLLELSYLESHHAVFSPEEFDIRHLVQEVLAGFGSQLKKRSLAVDDRIAESRVRADKNRICQVLTNLVDNAIKYSASGSVITLLSETRPDSVMITVQDQGPGIPARHINRLFERFYRVDKARSREMGGTGLGLSIVKHIVELHGGSVGVESDEGFGSRFWFTIPIK